jgi:CBS domain containing-hemolysin-like protein
VFRRSLDDIAGILHTKDVVIHFLERRESGSLAGLVRPVQRVPDTMSADRLLAFLRERRSHQALVVDETNRVVGLITLEDVLGELPLERARVWVGGAWPTNAMTVGEFIVREIGRVPEPSERITVGRLDVEIESADDTHITSAIVALPDGDGEPTA